MNHTPGAVTPLDPEMIHVCDSFGRRAQRRGLLQGAVRPVRVVEVLVLHLQDENGELFSLPAGWTDVVPADPFVVIADGRCPFTVVDGLLALADLIGRLRSLPVAFQNGASDGTAPGLERIGAGCPVAPGA